MFDDAPTTTIPSYASDGTTISFTIANLTDLTSGEAHATTGDIRKILFRLLDKIFTTWDALDEADQPTKVTFRRAQRLSGVGGNILQKYTIEFTVAGDVNVVAE